MSLQMFGGSPNLSSADIMAVWSSESKACFQSKNRRLSGLEVILDHSMARLSTKMGCIVLLCALNPYCVVRSFASQVLVSLACSIAAKILYVTFSREMGR